MGKVVAKVVCSFGDASLRLSGDIEAIAVSPSGARFAFSSGSSDGLIQVVDATTHVVEATLREPASALAFVDEETLWSAYAQTHCWRLGEPNAKLTLPHGAPLALSRATKRVAVTGRSGKESDVIVVDESGDVVTRLEGPGARVTALSFSPDGAQLAIGYETSAVLVELATEERRPLRVPGTNTVVRVAYDAVGRLLVWRDVSPAIFTLEPDGREGTIVLSRSIEGAATAPSTPRVAVTSGDGVRIYEADGTTRVLQSHALWGPIAFLDETRLVAARSHRVVELDFERGDWKRGAPGHSDEISAIAIAHDRKSMATAGGFDRTIHLWNLEDGTHVRAFEGVHENRILSLAFAPDGKTIASGSSDDSLRLTDVATGRSVVVRDREHAEITAAYSTRGDLVTVAGSGLVQLRDANGAIKSLVAKMAVTNRYDDARIAFDATGDYVGIAGPDEEVAIYGVFGIDAGRKTFGTDGRAKVIAFAPDAPLFAHATDDAVIVRNRPDGREVARFAVSIPRALTFLGEGRLVVAPFSDPPLLLDVTTQSQVVLDLPVATVVAAIGPTELALGFGNGTAIAVALANVVAPTLEPIRNLVRQLGVRRESFGYRDAPAAATLDGDPTTTIVIRDDVKLLVRVDAEGDEGWVLRIARADEPAAAQLARPPEPPSFWTRVRRWFGGAPPTPRMEDAAKPDSAFVARGALAEPPSPEQLEEWITHIVRGKR